MIVHYKDGLPARNLPKVLVTEITGHEEMIQFMSSYQKVDENGKHFHPRGALCWFACNRYGDPTGEVYVIKRVPEWRWIFDFANRGFQQLKKTRSRIPELKELFISDAQEEKMKFTDTTMRLHQTTQRHDRDERRKRRRRNASSKENN